MSSQLERLIHQSNATGSTGSLLNITAILAQAQRNNEAMSLIGVMAAHNDRYVQILEGAPHDLDGLLRRLQGDRQHRDIVILDRVPIPARSFGGWTMTSARITPEQAPLLDALMAGDRQSVDQPVAGMVAALALGGSAGPGGFATPGIGVRTGANGRPSPCISPASPVSALPICRRRWSLCRG